MRIHSGPVATLNREMGMSKFLRILSSKAPYLEAYEHAKIRAPKELTIRSKTESPVILTNPFKRLITIEGIRTDRSKNSVLPAGEICEAQENVPFQTLIEDFSKRPVRLSKNMPIAPVFGPPKSVPAYN